MLCPRCAFEGELIDGGCAYCGYGRSRISSGPLYSIDRRIAVYNSIDVAEHVLASGDVFGICLLLLSALLLAIERNPLCISRLPAARM